MRTKHELMKELKINDLGQVILKCAHLESSGFTLGFFNILMLSLFRYINVNEYD